MDTHRDFFFVRQDDGAVVDKEQYCLGWSDFTHFQELFQTIRF